jgi:hypothetical protein
MRRFVGHIAVIGLLTFGAESVAACALVSTLNLDDVQYADIVVLGQISNYRVHLEQFDGSSTPSRIGLFDVRVLQTLKGEVPDGMLVALDDRGQGLSPKLTEGVHLIAMRVAKSGSPRAPSSAWGELIPLSEAVSKFSVMNEPCEPAFILDARSTEAFAVVRSLNNAE